MVLKYDDSVAFWGGKKIDDSDGNILDAWQTSTTWLAVCNNSLNPLDESHKSILEKI